MMTLQLSPQIEARLTAAANQSGVEPPALAETLLSQYLPPAPTGGTPVVDEENAAAIAQIQAWLKEEATDDPEEIRQAQAELNELLENLNRNRVETGESPSFRAPSYSARFVAAEFDFQSGPHTGGDCNHELDDELPQ